ncbi:MAG: biotin transporter BioY [Bacteroidota bacterium]
MSSASALAPSFLHRLRSAEAAPAVQAAAIVFFTLLTVAGAQVKLYLWEVPFTLQTAAVYGSGLFLGWRNGMLAQVLYLTLGLFLPVFAGDGFGPAYLFAAASAGYLIAFPFVAALVGWASQQWTGFVGSILALLCGSAVLFTFGVTWLHEVAGHATWFESIDKGWLRFIPMDLAKLGSVALIYAGLRRI